MNRTCGDAGSRCSLCCRLVPVEEIAKHAGDRCRHQRHATGCRVHAGPGYPASCAVWSCRWLTDPATAALRRPDRTHYVIDVSTDVIRETDAAGVETSRTVLQVWCDPLFPNAWKDEALLAYIAASGLWAVVRYDQTRAIALKPPAAPGEPFITIPATLTTDIPGSIHNAMRERGAALPVRPRAPPSAPECRASAVDPASVPPRAEGPSC